MRWRWRKTGALSIYGGFEDLKEGVLRHVSAAFEEDPLRILRVSRFRAKLPWFRIAEETKAMLERMVESGEVDALVPERVTAEIRKALKEAKPSIFFDELETNGFMARVYPEWKQTDFSRRLLDRLASGFTEEENLRLRLRPWIRTNFRLCWRHSECLKTDGVCDSFLRKPARRF